MPETTPLVIANLGHRYGETGALDDVSLTVRSGEFVALLGASGCGKSTLLRAVAGLVTPTQGTVSIDGRVVSETGKNKVPASGRGVGLVFQDYALFPHMTVAENIGYGLRQADPGRVTALMTLVGIAELADRKPSELSGGQQQRVALARALAPRPALLLLDEPFANVDAGLRDALGRLLKRVCKDEGATVLMVTHDQESALALADRVVVLESGDRGGRVIQDASARQVYSRPANASVAQLTGAVVMLSAKASGATAASDLGKVDLVEELHGPVLLLLRPEQLAFNPSPEGSVRVSEVQFRGAHYHVRCHAACGVLDTLIPTHSSLPTEGDLGELVVKGPVWAIHNGLTEAQVP